MHRCITADGIADKNVMGAAEHNSVDLHSMVSRKVSVKQIIERILCKNTLFNALDKTRAGNIDDAGRVGHARLQIKIPLQTGCGPRGHHENLAISRLHACGLDGGFNADYGNIKLVADPFDASCRCRIAGNKNCFDALIRKGMRTAQRKLGDFRFCTIPIGSIAVVSIIYKFS